MGYRRGQSTDNELEDHGDVIAAAIATEHVASATGTAIPQSFYRPTNRPALDTATGTSFLLSPEVLAMEAEIDDAEERIANHNKGEKVLLGMLTLGGAFRFIEKLYAEDRIDFRTRRIAGNLLCDLFKNLRRDLTMYDFSRANPTNAGCK